MANTAQQKVAATVSFALAVYGNYRYLVGRSPFDKHSGFHVDDTPFTSNIIVVLVFWTLLYILQLGFLVKVFYPATEGLSPSGNTSRAEVTNVISYHFTLFNALSFVWSILFARKHWFWSEVILVINFFNITALYFNHKTYALKPFDNWALIHLPITAFPLSWLLYAIFWNGAVLFHFHHLFGRIVANLLIWDFLLVPGFFLVIYNDYGVGFSSAILVFGLALGQLFTKVIALQWIFAFIIAGLLALLSLVAAIRGDIAGARTSESAPLLSA